jgi:CRP-like cAMP-binding protein
MVRDYIALLHDVPPGSFDVEITPLVGNGLDEAVRSVRTMVADADRARREAAVHSRAIAGRLRDAGLSGRDVAHVLGVSAQRVSQLLKDFSGTGA